MVDFALILVIPYVLLVLVLAFVIVYPLARDISRDLFTSATAGEVVALCVSVMAFGGLGVFFFFFMVSAFVGLMVVLISLFSGLELVYWSKVHKVNLVLFVLSMALSLFLFRPDAFTQLVQLMKGGIYLVGVVQGANKHLLPVARSMYRDLGSEAYGDALVAVCVAVCGFTVFLSVMGIQAGTLLEVAPEFSDVAFAAGGVLAFAARHFLKTGGAGSRPSSTRLSPKWGR